MAKKKMIFKQGQKETLIFEKTNEDPKLFVSDGIKGICATSGFSMEYSSSARCDVCTYTIIYDDSWTPREITIPELAALQKRGLCIPTPAT